MIANHEVFIKKWQQCNLLLYPKLLGGKRKPLEAIASRGYCGAAGSRTRVQTSKLCAFYMLSHVWFFERGLERDSLPMPYLVCFRQGLRAFPRLVFSYVRPVT